MSRVRLALITAGFLVGLTLFGACLAPDSWVYASEFREARTIIQQIEAFRASRGEYPTELREVGRTDDEQGPFYYTRRDEGFVLSFPAPRHGFFANYVYDSQSKTWDAHD